MLAVPQVHLELLLGARIEAKVRLIGEIVRVEDHSHEAGLADERLRLLGLAAIHARVLPIAHLGFCVPIYDLKQCRKRAVDVHVTDAERAQRSMWTLRILKRFAPLMADIP